MRAALLAALIAVSILSTAVLAQTGGSVDLEAVSVTAPGVLTAGSPVQLTAAINEKLLGGKSATIPAYTVKFQYRKASSGLGGIFGRLVAQIAYPTGQQVVSPGSTPVISGADLAVTDISFADSMLQVTILNKGTETAKFTTDDIKIGLQHLCVPQGGQCADNPVLTKRCTSLPGGSCTLKNPWGVTCTCNFKPFAAAKSYTLAAGQSTVVSIPNVPAPTGDSQLYATINVPSLKEVNTADNTVKIKRTADGWTDIDGYDMSAHTITKTTQRRALKSWTPPASGAWEVRATVDSDNKVKESNEKNNVQTKRFEVKVLKPSNAPLGAPTKGGQVGGIMGTTTKIGLGSSVYIEEGDTAVIGNWSVTVEAITDKSEAKLLLYCLWYDDTVGKRVILAGGQSADVTSFDKTVTVTVLNAGWYNRTTGMFKGADIKLTNEH